jgi:hypothetical protein
VRAQPETARLAEGRTNFQRPEIAPVPGPAARLARPRATLERKCFAFLARAEAFLFPPPRRTPGGGGPRSGRGGMDAQRHKRFTRSRGKEGNRQGAKAPRYSCARPRAICFLAFLASWRLKLRGSLSPRAPLCFSGRPGVDLGAGERRADAKSQKSRCGGKASPSGFSQASPLKYPVGRPICGPAATENGEDVIGWNALI